MFLSIFRYTDWMGWHEQGDGKLFFGLKIENGRVIDRGDFKLKTALRKIVDEFNYSIVMCPTQAMILKVKTGYYLCYFWIGYLNWLGLKVVSPSLWRLFRYRLFKKITKVYCVSVGY